MTNIELDLIAFGFRPKPVFRQPFDAHVKAWEKVTRRHLWLVYHADSAFRAAYEREVYRRRNEPMPAWRISA